MLVIFWAADVASFTGAWIETKTLSFCYLCYVSHPLRVRGLKLISVNLGFIAWKSHPLRVRGLKLAGVVSVVIV